MTKPKSLIKIVGITMTSLYLLLVCLLVYQWVGQELKNAKLQRENIRKIYVNTKQEAIKVRVEHLCDYIRHEKALTQKKIKLELTSRTDEAVTTALYIYNQHKIDKSLIQIKKLVHDALYPVFWNKGRGSYFAYDMAGTQVIHQNNPEFAEKNIVNSQDSNAGDRMKKIFVSARSPEQGGFFTYDSQKPENPVRVPKISYVRYFEPLDWVMGTEISLGDEEEKTQQKIIKHIETIKFETHDYFFAGTWDGLSLSGPFAGKNMSHLTDPNGVKIVQELIGTAKSGGGFVEYVAPKFKGQVSAYKISYVQPLMEWKWYVGTGTYMGDLDSFILKQQKKFEKNIRYLIFKTMAILSLFLVISFLWIGFVSKKIKRNLDIFAIFFKRSANEAIPIEEDKLSFTEFQALAVSANQMSLERKKSEQALRESEERCKKLTNLTFEGILIHHKAIAIDVNDSLLKILGCTKKEIIGKNVIKEFIPHEYHALIKENLAKTSAKPYEVMARKKNGILFPMEIESKNIKIKNDTFRVSAVRDITQRKQAEAALKKSEQELRSIFRAAPTGIGLIRDRIFYQVNDRFCEIIGYAKNELIGQNARIVYPSDEEFEYVGKEKYEQISRKGTGTVETKLQKKDGKIIDVLLSSTPIDLHDLSKGVTFTALDITYLKTKELELLESEAKYRSMMEAMDDAVYICSSDYVIEYMNPAMIKRIGNDAVGGVCHKLIYGFDEKCPWCIREKIVDTEHMNYEILSPKDDHTYYVSNSFVSHIDGSISMLVIFRDVTELKKMESRMQQAQKMESIGTLAGGIAHDFNNILFPIIGHSEMLLEDAPEESQFRTSLDQIYTGAMRASELVKQILTFSRQEKNEVKLMKIQPIVKEALKLIRSTIPTTIEIKKNIQMDTGVIKADPTQIHQIVMNLSTNAFHAMEKTGGVLIISLKEIQLGEYDLVTSDMIPGVYVCLTVEDTGMGMEKNITKKIFDPFFTTKKTGRGTGMGLSVVHGIVSGMNGAIRVYSEPGKGTQFNVYFPVENNFLEHPKAKTGKPIQGGSEHILLVDDENEIVTMEKRMLERLGYQVTSRINSLEALEAFRARPYEFDLVITDMAMPNMPGDRLSTELSKIRPGIPILLCTGFSEAMSEEKAASLGIKGFLLKPIVTQDLSRKVRELLDK